MKKNNNNNNNNNIIIIKRPIDKNQIKSDINNIIHEKQKHIDCKKFGNNE